MADLTPRITITTGGNAATADEAAAITAAISRFTADTAVAPPPEDTGMNPWLKAALAEGVGAKSLFGPGGTEEPF